MGRFRHSAECRTKCSSKQCTGNVGPFDYNPITGVLNYTPAVHASGASTDASFIPDPDDVYDLGNATKRWRDLYLGP